ncbi:hypothetical protein BB560_002539 [Smittium megazygosporum]|uniref:Oxidase FUB9 n=1 Tax=Smittium megazygosporum TaxID=133381 RepID=A0A2T9ZEI3_9FUNG|nr:hypothetical protein BB560_002539 [Smittium megazygosporum]
MSKIASVQDLEDHAKANLDKNALNYYSSGSQDMITLQDNVNAFDRYQIRPRVLRNVSNVDTKVSAFGLTFDYPIFIAASAMQKMAHPDGELASVRSANKHNVCYSLSTISTSSIEEVSEAAGQVTDNKKIWFQLYIYNDKHKTIDLIKRAERAGFKAIILTADTPYIGRRLPDIRDPFMIPSHLKLKNIQTEKIGEAETSTQSSENASWLARYFKENINPGLTWDDVTWIKSVTSLPVLVKGVLTAEDAKLCLQYGADGIIVSNHGGRQLDTAPATIDALPEVVRAVNGKIPVFLDGGVRRGTDAFKALALGATAVFMGRPNLWGLFYDGENGVDLMLDIVFEEFKLAMALSGCASVKDINESYIQDSRHIFSKL